MKAAAECIPRKPRAKCRIPWESLVLKKKKDNMKIASLLNKRNLTNANIQKLKKVLRELTYKKEHKYIQGQINKIRNSVEDRQS